MDALYGYGSQIVHGYQRILNTSSSNTTENLHQVIDELVSYILNILDTFEETAKEIYEKMGGGDNFGITPTTALPDVDAKLRRSTFISRRLYYEYGFTNNPDGTCNCEKLRYLYETHPYLKEYDFETSEPQCCL